MLNKPEIFLTGYIQKMNENYKNIDSGYYAVDSYYLALRDINFISEDQYSSVHRVNEAIYVMRKERGY
jgi:hypothetical protein